MAQTRFSGPVVSTAGFTGAVTGNVTGNLTGNVTGNVTGVVTGDAYRVQAVTATADGTTTGTILSTTTHATVTSDGATKQVILPAPTPGRQVIIDVGANGFDLKSSAPATVAINGGTGAAAKSPIAANSTCYMVCVSATAWKGFFMDADGDLAKVVAAS